MKNYTKPEIAVKRFYKESIITDSMTTVDSIQTGNVFNAVAAKIDYSILETVIGFK